MTISRTSVIFAKDVAADRVTRVRISTLIKRWGVLENTLIDHIREESTSLIRDRFLLGTNDTELKARLPVFHLKACRYRVMRYGQKRGRFFSSQTEAVRYSTSTMDMFQEALSVIISSRGLYTATTARGDAITLIPPVTVKGGFIVERDMYPTLFGAADDLYLESETLMEKANNPKDLTTNWFTVVAFVPQGSEILCHTPWVSTTPEFGLPGTYFCFTVPATDVEHSVTYVSKRIVPRNGHIRVIHSNIQPTMVSLNTLAYIRSPVIVKSEQSAV